MIANFYDIFDKTPDNGSDIPQEILDILSQNLPSTFMYYRNKDGVYMAGPKLDHISDSMILKVDIDEKFINKYLKGIPSEKWAEYLYRMQLRVPVKHVRIGNKEKQIPIEETIGSPLGKQTEITDSFLYPEPFPPAKKIVFETVEGDIETLSIARKPYNSFEEEFYTNIDFPALQIKFYLSDKLTTSRCVYTIKPQKAASVQDALKAIHIFDGLRKGTLKINGKKLTFPLNQKTDFDMEHLKNAKEFWTTAEHLERLLDVSFIPNADFPIEDVEFFSHLSTCLLNNKSIVWEHPCDHFHVNWIKDEYEKREDLLGKESLEYNFLEGPISATLLGTKFDVYSYTTLSNIVITNIIWDDAEKKSGEIYISDPIGTKWKLYRKFLTKEQYDNLKNSSFLQSEK